MKKCISGVELNVFNCLVTSYISEILDNEQMSILGNFLLLVGQTLVTISDQNNFCGNLKNIEK